MDRFTCPCSGCPGEVRKVDDRYTGFGAIRVQSELSFDPFVAPGEKAELWYCCSCAGYFRAYYRLDRVEALGLVKNGEEEDRKEE
jgi:hypothetical protein